MDSLTFQDSKVFVKHLIMPGFENDRCPIVFEEETIADFLGRSRWVFKLPTICVVNGTPVMRKDWATTTISSSDRVEFLSRPYGSGSGGNKARSVLSLVALVALAAFAPYIAGPAGLALAAGSFQFYATVAAITLAGGFLISTFLAPKAAANDEPATTQIYSLTAGGNVASPFQTIPVQYGRLKREPPYAAIPWQEYIGDDAYLNVLLCNGMGKYYREQILIDDTILWDSVNGVSASFTDVTMQFCDPGQAFTLFPSNVTTSSEVNGQELTLTPIGYYIVNASGTSATDIAFDFVLPAGLFGVGAHGEQFPESVNIRAQIQQVNDAGTPTGSVVTVISETITLYQKSPHRWTEKISLAAFGLPPGRYQARVWRDPASTGDTEHITDIVNWLGVRAYLEGSNTFTDVSVTGIRIKATSQLSQSSAKKFGIIQTRILPVWNGSTMVEEPTTNAWWAFYDAATNSTYGAQWPISKIDFQTIVDEATKADVREDSFNYTFDSAVTFQAAFDLILASNRSKVAWLGDVLSAVRDEWRPIPQMLISDQQIVRGTMEIDYILNDESSSDCVRGQFLNENTWQPAQLQYPPNSNSFTAVAPASTQIDGITNPDQMYSELKFLYKQSQLRRMRIKLETEHDGRLLRFGSSVKIQSNLPKRWGASGEINSYNSTTKILTLSRTLTSEIGQHYIELRNKTGGYFGPVKCSIVGGHANQLLLDSTDLAEVESDLNTTIDDALDRMDGAEPPSFVYGLAAKLSRNCLVLSGQPNGHRVELELTVDSEAVHDDAGADIPLLPSANPLLDPKVPIILGLVAYTEQNVTELHLRASWWPAAGALVYKAQVSYDEGLSWTTVKNDNSDPVLDIAVAPVNLRLRVAGIGIVQGPWTVVDVTAQDITNPFLTGPANLAAGLRDYVMRQLQVGADEANRVRQIMASATAEQDAAQALELIAKNTNIKVLHDFVQSDYNTKIDTLTSAVTTADAALSASITTTQQTVADNAAAQATLNTSVNASISALNNGLVTANANITTNANAIVTTNGALASLTTSVTASFLSTNANVTANTAAITTEQTARANADTAIASSVTSLTATVATNTANITTNATAIATTDSTVASLTTSVSSQFATTNANVTTNANAISSTNSALASLTTSVSASFATTNANVATNATAIATINTSFSSYQTTVNAHLGTLDSSVSTNASAIATANGIAAAIFTLTLDVNHYVSGYTSTNTGNFSTFTVIADIFNVAQPGVGGGGAVTIFQIAAVNGSAKVSFRGDMFADGSITTNTLAALAVTTAKLDAGAVTANKITAQTIATTEISVGGVDFLNLVAGAATAQQTSTYSSFVASTAFASNTLTIKGGTASILWMADSFNLSTVSGVTDSIAFHLRMNGSIQRTWAITLFGGRTDPLMMGADITGLSSGSYTFDLTATLGGSVTIGSGGNTGSLRVQDLRR